jgi:hypothetical protein
MNGFTARVWRNFGDDDIRMNRRNTGHK